MGNSDWTPRRSALLCVELGYYLQNPGQILAIWNGGITIYGGLIAGGTLYWYAKEKRYFFWPRS